MTSKYKSVFVCASKGTASYLQQQLDKSGSREGKSFKVSTNVVFLSVASLMRCLEVAGRLMERLFFSLSCEVLVRR